MSTKVEDRSAGHWLVVGRFVIHSIVGLLVFSVICGAAVAFHFLVEYLVQLNVGKPIIFGCRLVEYSVFGVDLVLYFRFLGTTAIQAWKELG